MKTVYILAIITPMSLFTAFALVACFGCPITGMSLGVITAGLFVWLCRENDKEEK